MGREERAQTNATDAVPAAPSPRCEQRAHCQTVHPPPDSQPTSRTILSSTSKSGAKAPREGGRTHFPVRSPPTPPPSHKSDSYIDACYHQTQKQTSGPHTTANHSQKNRAAFEPPQQPVLAEILARCNGSADGCVNAVFSLSLFLCYSFPPFLFPLFVLCGWRESGPACTRRARSGPCLIAGDPVFETFRQVRVKDPRPHRLTSKRVHSQKMPRVAGNHCIIRGITRHADHPLYGGGQSMRKRF